MRNGICDKCGNASVFEVDASKYADTSIPLTSWVAVGVTYYICTMCGYVEMYALDRRGLERIAKDKPKVPVSES